MNAPSPSLRRLRLTALGMVVGVLALNLVVRSVLLSGAYDGVRLIPGLLDLRYAENHGVSFSLLWQHSDAGTAGLVFLQLIIIALIAVGAFRATRMSVSVGLGLVIGGALANVLDRGWNGAVFDYLYVHLGGWPLFVCNLPDIAISAGVLCLLADMAMRRRAELGSG